MGVGRSAGSISEVESDDEEAGLGPGVGAVGLALDEVGVALSCTAVLMALDVGAEVAELSMGTWPGMAWKTIFEPSVGVSELKSAPGNFSMN